MDNRQGEITYLLKRRFNENAEAREGDLEQIRERIDKLEDAIIQMVCFMADHLKLSDDDIINENGLADW